MLNSQPIMFTQSCQLLCRKITPFSSLQTWSAIVALLILSTGCSPKKPPDIELKINNVQSSGRPGLYSIVGNTNLPNKSRIVVSAIRYLRSNPEEFLSAETNTNYSILDRQIVTVDQGKWQANLNLWQVAPNGVFQEAWQQTQSQGTLPLEPTPGVTFLVTFEQDGQLLTAEEQKQPTIELIGNQVRFTSEGKPYLQASQTLRVGLPTGKTTPPIVRAEYINDGWGNRSEIKPESPGPSRITVPTIRTKQTNAPLSPSEFFR